MAFRVCCSCKTPLGPSEGFVSRLCRVTQTLGTVIGTESYFWTPVSGYTDKWELSFTAPSTGDFLLEGFRVEWYGPTADGQKFNGMYPIADSNNISTLYEYIRDYYLNTTYSVGTQRKYDSGKAAFFRVNNRNHFPYANLFNTKVPLGGHVSNESLRGISFGSVSGFGATTVIPPVRVSDASYTTVPTEVRVKHWRLLANGNPVSDIMPGYHPDSRTSQTMMPSEDVQTTTWNASTGADFFALIDEPVTSADNSTYIWSGQDGSDGITFKLTDFIYTGGYNYVDVRTRASIVDAAGTLVSSSSLATKIVLKYEGQDIAYALASITGNGTTFTSINFRFTDLANFSAPIKESCSFIPVDADPTKFSIKITVTIGNTATRRVAFSALNVVSEPFSYFLGSNAAQVWWPIETAYRMPWRKNARLGFDIWLEAVRNSGATFTAGLGRVNQTAGKYEGLTADSAHGTLAIRTTFMPEYDPTEFTYYVKFLNGTWRPSQLDLGSTDTKTFLNNRSGVDFSTGLDERTGFSAAIGQNPEDGRALQISLRWNQEVPEVFISCRITNETFQVNGVNRDSLKYIPEDTGHAITNFWFYHGSTLGNVYVNSQSPGGVWKHKKVTKFVLERPTQTSTTNSFSSEDLISLSGFPTEIEVGPAYPPTTYSFWETTEWECPSNISIVTVRCWGGGGGGGATDDYSGSAAGGGGGGAFSSKNISVTPGTIYTITVGSGGAGGVDGNINGQAGGDSWFSDAGTVMAKGGSGGTGALLDDDETGGAGGASASGVGTTKFSGGNGADGSSGNYGGGGGASAGTNNNGAAATNATGATGTNNGGNGGTGTTATAGGLPGGGGGGAKGTAASDTILPGGAGGGGLVTLRY